MENFIRYQDLHIPEPCHENWEAMDATERGRLCQRCKKEVIDFTFKTQREFNEIIASGTWSGCGRFLTKRLGKPPVVEARHVQLRRNILERWRHGAAAAMLFVSLWQLPTMGKAASKSVICLVPQPLAPSPFDPQTEPNYVLSAILTSEYGETLPDDFHVVVTLPNGDTIPITTQQGFFGIDLEGRAKPEDTILITVPPQTYQDDGHKSKYELTELKVRLAEGQNILRPIHAIFKVEDRQIADVKVIKVYHTQGIPAMNQELTPMPLIGSKTPTIMNRPEPEPLFKTRTPEEKAQQKSGKQNRTGSK